MVDVGGGDRHGACEFTEDRLRFSTFGLTETHRYALVLLHCVLSWAVSSAALKAIQKPYKRSTKKPVMLLYQPKEQKTQQSWTMKEWQLGKCFIRAPST